MSLPSLSLTFLNRAVKTFDDPVLSRAELANRVDVRVDVNVQRSRKFRIFGECEATGGNYSLR